MEWEYEWDFLASGHQTFDMTACRRSPRDPIDPTGLQFPRGFHCGITQVWPETAGDAQTADEVGREACSTGRDGAKGLSQCSLVSKPRVHQLQ